jgi:choline dehydrogenase-like flavoprotein
MPSAARAAVALVEAIIPGSSATPAADERTVELTDELLAEIHPTLARAWRVALRTLDAAATLRTGRPFHSLTAERQQELLRQWETDPLMRRPLGLVSLVYKFVHFDRAVAGAPGNPSRLRVVQALEQPRWLRQITPLEQWASADLECDVVVVGSGAGGAVVGRELADRGYAVAFLEEGDHHRRDAFDGSSVGAHQRFYRGAVSVGNVVMPVFMGRLVGGSTAINGGTCFRAPPWVLERWADEMRTGELSPEGMRPYYERVEQVLDVHPARPDQIGPIGDLMARGCDALGWHHFAIPRNAPDCDGSGFCDFGCPTDARRGANISYLPPALERGAVLLTGARVDRVVVEAGRAVGVEAVGKTGRRVRVRARAVVLAGGAVPTPLLLLQQGLANRSGQVGRNLTLHPSAGLSALFDGPIDGHKHTPQGYACDQFLREGFMMMAAQPTHNIAPILFPVTGHRLMEVIDRQDDVASFALMLRDSSRNGRVWRDVGGLPAITYSVTAEDAALMHRAMVLTAEMALAAGARMLYPASLRHSILAPGELDEFRRQPLQAADVMWLSYHPLGTCQMGVDPATSVIGTDHETHDVPGLYVIDGAAVPGPLGVNPQLTIMAMATRAAQKLADKLA